MTSLEVQKSVVAVAIKKALHKVGLKRISKSEFFGTNQTQNKGNK